MSFFENIKKNAAEAAEKIKENASRTAEAARVQADGLSENLSAGLQRAKEMAGETWNSSLKTAEEIGEWAKTVPDTIHKYYDNFSPEEFREKIATSALSAGRELVARVLLIYYTVMSPDDKK